MAGREAQARLLHRSAVLLDVLEMPSLNYVFRRAGLHFRYQGRDDGAFATTAEEPGTPSDAGAAAGGAGLFAASQHRLSAPAGAEHVAEAGAETGAEAGGAEARAFEAEAPSRVLCHGGLRRRCCGIMCIGRRMPHRCDRGDGHWRPDRPLKVHRLHHHPLAVHGRSPPRLCVLLGCGAAQAQAGPYSATSSASVRPRLRAIVADARAPRRRPRRHRLQRLLWRQLRL
mmetsp:Transcript_83582/g.240172  ORF Transcript_83582/g.240172 Transcript_83582/m.240172 type:complete len:228 (-) Transcript_83582:832-1515(-)